MGCCRRRYLTGEESGLTHTNCRFVRKSPPDEDLMGSPSQSDSMFR